MDVAGLRHVAAPFQDNPIEGAKVLIVSSDYETLDGTCDYLKRVGAAPRMATNLSDAIGEANGAQAVIFFADGYAKERALETLRAFSQGRSAKVIVVVSEQVEFFSVSGASALHACVTVLRRPTWGWMLLDALRARLATSRLART